MSMTLEQALAYVDRGIGKAVEMGVQVSLAVVDEFGQIVQLDRMDGAALMTPDIAEAKAVTALNFKRATGDVAMLDREMLRSIEAVVHFKMMAVAGGLPIYDGTTLKGAIGVSGATAAQDAEIASHATGG